MTVDELRADAWNAIAAYTGKCWLDGNELPGATVESRYRVVSPVFRFRSPAGNILEYPSGLLVDPVVADGVWIMLQPLAAGRHTVRFFSSSLAEALTYDFTYNLDIVASKK